MRCHIVPAINHVGLNTSKWWQIHDAVIQIPNFIPRRNTTQYETTQDNFLATFCGVKYIPFDIYIYIITTYVFVGWAMLYEI